VIVLKFHIVRTGEDLEDILFLYNLTKDELIEENRHIRVWNKLVPGTKLKIPPITEAMEHDINEMEPFVEDYYPKLSDNQDDIIHQGKDDESQINSEEKNIDDAVELIKTIDVKDTEKKTAPISETTVSKIKTATKPQSQVNNPYYLAYYNYPRQIPHLYIFYPIYYQKRP
jgi:hypothetical protein